MQMLAAGGIEPLVDADRPPDINNPRGYYELTAVKRLASDPSFLTGAHGRAVKIIHQLIPHLPLHHTYRVILVERPIAEVLASQHAMLQQLGKPVASAPPTDAKLAAAFASQLQRAIAHLQALPACELLRLAHRALMADPETEARRLADFIGRPGTSTAMAAAVDPTLYRRRAPDHRP